MIGSTMTKIALAIAASVYGASAHAGILASPVDNTTGIIKGNTAVSGSTVPSLGQIDGSVDWSVFAPGSGFQQFLSDNGLALVEDFSPSNYVYAYQVFNVASQSPGFPPFVPPADIDLSFVTVGLDSGDVVVPGSIGSLSTAVGDHLPFAEATSFSGVVPNNVTSAGWGFFTNGGVSDTIPVGEQSGLLFFASPSPPEFDNVDLAAGAPSASTIDGVPSPGVIPEPAALSLLVIASLGVGAFGSRGSA